MSTARSITVIWMDDVTETYPGVETSLRDNVLHLYRYSGVTRTLIAEWHHPTSNIRTWHPEGNPAP